MSDIVERLRDYETVGVTALPKLCGEAADRIEALEAALREIVYLNVTDSDDPGRIARAALEGKCPSDA